MSNFEQLACLSVFHDKLRCEYSDLPESDWCAYCKATHEQHAARVTPGATWPGGAGEGSVHVFLVNVPDTMEERIVDVLMRKRAMVEAPTDDLQTKNLRNVLRYVLTDSEDSDTLTNDSGDSAAPNEEVSE